MWTGHWEWVVVLVVVLLLFGGRKIPELARSLGKSIKEFKKGAQEVSDDVRSAIEDDQDTKGSKDA